MSNGYGKGLKRLLSFFLSFLMVITMLSEGALGSITRTVNAKEIGKKNETQKETCKAVADGTEPDGYTDLGNGAVYRGGDSLSQWQVNNNWWKGKALDDDQNTFANPLPYGDTFVDTTKLKWDNSDNFIIDIQDERFKWVKAGDEPLTDKNGARQAFE